MIQTAESSITYNGSNSTTVAYPIPFLFYDNNTIHAIVRDELGVEEEQTNGTDFTLTGAGNPDGGSLLMTWAVPSTSSVTIFRVVPFTQQTSYEEGDSFPAKSHERALDKLTMECQQLSRGMGTGTGDSTDLGTAFRVTEASGTLTPVGKVDDSILGIDALGNTVLRTAGNLLGWLGQVGTVWPDTPTRLVTRGAYAGQLGVQIDNGTIYIANSTTPGDWFPFLIGTGIVAATNGVPYLMTPPAGDLVGTDEAQTLYNKTLESPTIHTPTGLTKNDVGLSQVDNTSDLSKPLSSATGAALAFKQDKTEKGVSNGYPSLDGGGKIPLAQIPDSVIGASQYQGTWNATTNTPAIPAAALGNKGWYYSVAVAGTTSIDGINSWAVGDQIISNGTIWQKIVNVSAVQSVNSKTGTVVINKADVGLGNVDNLSQAQMDAAATTLTNKTIRGAQQTLMEVRLDADVINSLPVARLNNGTGASGTTWWCGDGSWKQPPGTGDVAGPGGANDGELCLYSGTTGKVIRRFSGTPGFAKASGTGLLTTSPLIHGADLDPDVIGGQPEITSLSYLDYLLVREAATGLLKKIGGSLVAKLPRNHVSGLILSNNVSDTANDIDIAIGECRSDDNTADIVLTTAITKRLDATWVAGTNQGGRDTGVISDTTWHVYAIRNPGTNAVDVLFTQTYGSPTMPSGFTQKRRIGSIMRRVTAGGIIPFKQYGDYFQISVPGLDVNLNYSQSSTSTITFINVPLGKKFRAHIELRLNHTAASAAAAAYDLDTAVAPSWTVYSPAANISNVNEVQIWTNPSAQVGILTSANIGTFNVSASVLGYFDEREKNS